MEQLKTEAISLLKSLISTPSFSSEEDATASLLEGWFQQFDIPFNRQMNNVWAVNKHFDPSKPILLLNSHHDTVKPNKGYTLDPFQSQVKDGKLYGLGSNDAGGALVSLMATFTHFYSKEDPLYNLLIAATGEEETSGPNGLKGLLPHLPEIDVAIVGEPTLLDLAVAEKGLVVFDAKVKGTAGHAAHPNPDNAIYKAARVLDWFSNFKFDRSSDSLGDVKATVTQIHAGEQHNAIPAEVNLVIDVRVNDKYTNNEILEILTEKAPCDWISARGLDLNSSSIPLEHPLVKAGIELGHTTYGSPTLSDQAALSCPSLKMGPGDSTRSHTADEFIYLKEIEEGIETYVKLLEKVL